MADRRETRQPAPPIAEISKDIPVGDEFKDGNGHVNNAGYLTYAERERARMFKERGIDLQGIMSSLGITIIASEINIRYGREFVPGDHATITTRLSLEGRMKMLFDQQMSKKGEKGIVHQKTTCLFVAIDPETKRPKKIIPIPEKILNTFTGRPT